LAFNVADASATALVPDDTAFSKSQACVRAVKAITSFSTLSFQLSASSLSSTQLVADAIKTMDMTMPSYDTISTSKNTQETLSSLVIEQPTAVTTPKKAASKQKGEPMKGPSLGAVLPSLNKEGPKKKATAAAKKAQQGTSAKQMIAPAALIVSPQPHYSRCILIIFFQKLQRQRNKRRMKGLQQKRLKLWIQTCRHTRGRVILNPRTHSRSEKHITVRWMENLYILKLCKTERIKLAIKTLD
jgi:hypothetical protein